MRSWTPLTHPIPEHHQPRLYRQSTALNLADQDRHSLIRSPVMDTAAMPPCSDHYTLEPAIEGHGLPKKFLGALRELFDVLDDRKSGLLRVADIQSRWMEEQSAFFPKGMRGIRWLFAHRPTVFARQDSWNVCARSRRRTAMSTSNASAAPSSFACCATSHFRRRPATTATRSARARRCTVRRFTTCRIRSDPLQFRCLTMLVWSASRRTATP